MVTQLHRNEAKRLVKAAGELGVALVITLILLSVITFMAVTFLVVTQTQRGSVQTETEQKVATLAADTAQERAIGDLVSSINAFSNAFGYGLRVSTNYIGAGGFIPGNSSPTNVGYNYLNGLPINNQNDLYQGLANLLYDPRAPVYIVTNHTTGAKEFRYYVDLNRNGRYDTNGWLPVMNPNGGYYDTNGNPTATPIAGNTLSNFYVGDPEWIAILERPGFPPGLLPPTTSFPRGFPHSGTNRVVSRYAYIVVPIGRTLDINYLHNYTKMLAPNMLYTLGDGFRRNQGVGTWEANLAAFLVDLNTNLWPYPLDSAYGSRYQYDLSRSSGNQGSAFDDAASLLRYRYDGNFTTLSNVNTLFGAPGVLAFSRDSIDGYARNLNLAPVPWAVDADPSWVSVARFAWPGSYNPNHYFTTQELFDKNKTARTIPPNALSFADRVRIAGTNNSSYDRYTFYRLLSQLGTDAEEETGKLNLNYVNVDNQGTIIPNLATNFTPWTPLQFFTNAAIKMLVNAGYSVGQGITNMLIQNGAGGINLQIQVWPTNYYTPDVHRIFQLAANLYDSTTNRSDTDYPHLPSVFRPIVSDGLSGGGGNQIFITGFTEVTSAASVLAAPRVDPSDTASRPLKPNAMIYGQPLVIGAKKGFPNFNEFGMQTRIQVTRKLEFRRPTSGPNLPVNETNVMYSMSISNTFGVEAWNSYKTTFPRSLRMVAFAEIAPVFTNENGNVQPLLRTYTALSDVTIPASSWDWFQNPSIPRQSFKLALDPAANHFLFLTNCTWSHAQQKFLALTGTFEQHPNASVFPVPHWWLNLRTRLLFVLVDVEKDRIVDYVNLSSKDEPLNIADFLMRDSADKYGQCSPPYHPSATPGSLWCTNRWPNSNSIASPTFGMWNQIKVCLSDPPNLTPDWNSAVEIFPPGMDRLGAIDFFRVQFADQGGYSPINYPNRSYYLTNTFYAPFNPVRTIFMTASLQANDPLVHYTVDDLRNLQLTNKVDINASGWNFTDLGGVNRRYEPWSTELLVNSSGKSRFDLSLKDPMLTRSDDYDFPTNKLASIGDMGRVHRGTPWQTVYLKAPAADVNGWRVWTGNSAVVTNFGQYLTSLIPITNVAPDAILTHPVTDRHILDLFTTSFNDNSARGKMSVNQDGLAAWSAILSGVIVVTNTSVSNSFSDIKPAGVYNAYDTNNLPPVVRIWQGINRTRNTFTNSARAFPRLGDVLATPELSVGQNPVFTNTPNPGYWLGASPYLDSRTNVLNDAVYERIPQQILGLLKGSEQPRFAIYAYGQALKVADRAVVLSSGPFYLMPTNYQIMAEQVTRTVVRIEGAPTNTHAVIESFTPLGPD